VQEKLTESGIPCNLLTGQEQIIFPGCQKMSCTVEMVSTESEFDVAVIDEIQMIGIVIQYIYSGCCYSLAKKKGDFCAGVFFIYFSGYGSARYLDIFRRHFPRPRLDARSAGAELSRNSRVWRHDGCVVAQRALHRNR
jgi:hypothetical protein